MVVASGVQMDRAEEESMRVLAFTVAAGLLVACVSNVEPTKEPEPTDRVLMSVAGTETSRPPSSELEAVGADIINTTSCELCCGKAGYGYYYSYWSWGQSHCICGNSNDYINNPPYTCW
jgi:hypothetical protein